MDELVIDGHDTLELEWGGDVFELAGDATVFLSGGAGGDADTLGGQNSAYHLNRQHHTGEQAQSTVTGLVAALSALEQADAAEAQTRQIADANLQSQITDVQTLAQTNQLNLGTKADQVDLDATNQQVEANRLALLNKADLTALATLTALVGTKADQSYVNDQIAALVGTDGQVLAAIQAIATELANAEGVLEALDQTVANRVRFDVATQALTALQKSNARTNIGAEEAGEAARLIALITAASIGAATAAQGAKADTALQSADVAPVALSGLFSSLADQNKIFDVAYNAYTATTSAVISAGDALGLMLSKLQAQITQIRKKSYGDYSDWRASFYTSGSYYTTVQNSSFTLTQSASGGTSSYMPFECKESVAIAALAINVTTAGANSTIYLGLFIADSTGQPATEIFVGTVSGGTTGLKEVELPSVYNATAGQRLMLGYCAMGSVPSVSTLPSSAMSPISGSANAASAPAVRYLLGSQTSLTATTQATLASTNAPAVFFKVA